MTLQTEKFKMKKPLLLTTYYLMREQLGEALANDQAMSDKVMAIIIRINRVRYKRTQLRNQYENLKK